ncbi:MAG TPA: MarC family protein [Vicinamibacterales bacterium]|nr:MarC family protein [Vicinamibacterales bacterium]
MNASAELGFALLAFTSLLAIVNPLSATPMFLALTAGYSTAQRRRTLQRAVVTALLVMVGFALLGRWIFTVYGITINAFRIAGGLIFFGIGLDMLQAKRSRVKATEEEESEGSMKEDVGITPLGMPMITGPGTITTVMVLVSQAQTRGHLIAVYGAMIGVSIVTWIVLAASNRVVALFGQTGLNVMTRLMGLLVTVVGVQSIIDGVTPVAVAILRQSVLR